MGERFKLFIYFSESTFIFCRRMMCKWLAHSSGDCCWYARFASTDCIGRRRRRTSVRSWRARWERWKRWIRNYMRFNINNWWGHLLMANNGVIYNTRNAISVTLSPVRFTFHVTTIEWMLHFHIIKQLTHRWTIVLSLTSKLRFIINRSDDDFLRERFIQIHRGLGQLFLLLNEKQSEGERHESDEEQYSGRDESIVEVRDVEGGDESKGRHEYEDEQAGDIFTNHTDDSNENDQNNNESSEKNDHFDPLKQSFFFSVQWRTVRIERRRWHSICMVTWRRRQHIRLSLTLRER